MADADEQKPPFSREDLMTVLTALGAEDPGGWADSQLEENVPQLHRFVFLAKAWSQIPNERDHGWIDADIEHYKRRPDAPYAGGGRSLSRLRALGATDADLTELVRAKLAEFLFHVSYVLADPDYIPDERYQAPRVADVLKRVDWAFCALDGNGEPVGVIESLQESVLETDPMGREVRPVDSKST